MSKQKIKLKVCGLKFKNNLFDVVNAGVDFVGMIFYEKSPRYVIDTLYPEDIWCLPDEVEKIGVFVNADIDFVKKYVRLYQLDFIQLHGNESPEICRQLSELDYRIIKVFAVDENFDFGVMQAYLKVVDYFLLDTKTSGYGGSGNTFDWNILEKYPYQVPIFIGGGIGIENMQELLEKEYPFIYALDMNSRLESEPGIKDITKVKEAVSIRNNR
ncbi:MAG: phosphoribosylanthranilate isomerase [Chitinophagales bacterium]|nr:phosphoribosylanthranilate isomerase [Chitinophagales bacterium]